MQTLRLASHLCTCVAARFEVCFWSALWCVDIHCHSYPKPVEYALTDEKSRHDIFFGQCMPKCCIYSMWTSAKRKQWQSFVHVIMLRCIGVNGPLIYASLCIVLLSKLFFVNLLVHFLPVDPASIRISYSRPTMLRAGSHQMLSNAFLKCIRNACTVIIMYSNDSSSHQCGHF